MISLATFTTPAHECAYLPDRQSTMLYELVLQCNIDELGERLETGWRRFGHAFFRPSCDSCRSCQSMRVPVATFQSNRSQRRAVRDNQDIELRIVRARVTQEKLDLYDRFHDHQAGAKGWPSNSPKDAKSYRESFVEGPVPTEEWQYYLGERLIGVGYVDVTRLGLSAIYFFHDPEFKNRSLGTLNVMSIIAEAAHRRLPYVYLGYFVDGCGSLQYKENFRPSEVIDETGKWTRY